MNNPNRPFIPTAHPSTVLGVMGGGQLGRMFAHAAQAMGYQVAVLEPAEDCPAGQVADRLLNAPYTDAAALAQLAGHCVAVTTEFENVPAASMAALADTTFVAPSAQCVSVAQDRLLEKKFFVDCAPHAGVGPAPHLAITSAADISAVPDALLPGILKTVRMGYDGKGQARVTTRAVSTDTSYASGSIFSSTQVTLPIALKADSTSARGADGATVVYPIAENVHRDGILFTTTVPSPNVTPAAAAQAQAAARVIVERLGYVGVLCIEFFVLGDGSLVVNEMAPRPHNSGHYTMDACVTSQFAQQVRATARVPLGDVRQHSPAVMLNLLGDLWFDAQNAVHEPDWAAVLALPGACLHLYGKDEPRAGRKMGHLTFIAPTLDEATAQLRLACAILRITL
jgi:5-(carboxyamino)imidazole ribonucleotide synthase